MPAINHIVLLASGFIILFNYSSSIPVPNINENLNQGEQNKDSEPTRFRRSFRCYQGICKRPPFSDTLVKPFNPSENEIDNAETKKLMEKDESSECSNEIEGSTECSSDTDEGEKTVDTKKLDENSGEETATEGGLERKSTINPYEGSDGNEVGKDNTGGQDSPSKTDGENSDAEETTKSSTNDEEENSDAEETTKSASIEEEDTTEPSDAEGKTKGADPDAEDTTKGANPDSEDTNKAEDSDAEDTTKGVDEAKETTEDSVTAKSEAEETTKAADPDAEKTTDDTDAKETGDSDVDETTNASDPDAEDATKSSDIDDDDTTKTAESETEEVSEGANSDRNEATEDTNATKSDSKKTSENSEERDATFLDLKAEVEKR